jgi:hypothetical protein
MRAFGVRHTVRAWFIAVAAGYVAYMVAGLSAAEVLGAFDAVDQGALAIWWIAYGIVTIATACFLLRKTRPPGLRALRNALSPMVVIAIGSIGLLAGFLFWLGASTAPDNPDAADYHLTRAAIWATNHNVGNFPTNRLLLLQFGRLSEYFLTQVLSLDGTDRLVFLPQWIAYVVVVLLVAGLARELGGGRRGALWGALLAGTLPLGIMEATTPQNDLFVASIVLAAFYLLAVLYRERRFHPSLLVVAGAAAGLAILTKADALVPLFAVGAVLVFMVWWRGWPFRQWAVWGLSGLVLLVTLTFPSTLRNLETFENPFGSVGEALIINRPDPVGIASNMVKGLLLNLDSIDAGVNERINRIERAVGQPLGWDQPTLTTSLYTTWPTAVAPPSTEDDTGNFVAYLALVIAGLGLLWPQIRRRALGRGFGATTLASVIGLLLTAALLKWSPFASRYQLTALYPALACASVVLASIRRKWVVAVVGSLLVVLSLLLATSGALKDESKPVLGSTFLSEPRIDQYFRWYPCLQPPYRTAVTEAHRLHQTTIGYVSQPYIDIEYPLWVLMSIAAQGKPVYVVPLALTNVSTRYETPTSSTRPDVALVSGLSVRNELRQAKPLGSLGYVRQSVSSSSCGVFGIYVRSSAQTR